LAGRDGCDFSFSGLKTAAARAAMKISNAMDRRDLAAAVQLAIATQLADRTAVAMRTYARHHAQRRFVVAGGVAANQAVRNALIAECEAAAFEFFAPPLAYCTDNAAMIALAGAERLMLGLTSPLNVSARPRWPLDETAATDAPMHKTAGRKGAKA